MRRIFTFLIVAACSTAGQARGGSAGMQISAYVPEVCEIESTALVVDSQAGTTERSVFEMCNSGRQFRVIASYRALDDDEQVRINYGGEVHELDSSGMSDVGLRRGPMVRHVPISVQTSDLSQTLAISLGIAAI